MSSSTTRQTPLQVTPASFNHTINPFLLSKTARPKSSSPWKQRKPKVTSRPRHSSISEQHQQREEQQMENMPLDYSTPALRGIVIYIDKSVMNKNSLMGMANALAATIVDKWGPSVTHLIHGPVVQQPHQQKQHSTPHIISRSLEKKMRVVSPVWITACYNNKERMPESYYPYDMNSHNRKTLLRFDSSADIVEDENPFGLEPDEFATMEYGDDDDDDDGPAANDRRVTDYFQPINNNNNNNSRNNHDDNDDTAAANTCDDQQDDNYYTEAGHLDFDDDTGNMNNRAMIINNRDKDKRTANDEHNDDTTGISYSLIEMTQIQPEQRLVGDIPDTVPVVQQQQQQQVQRQQGDCAYEGTSSTRLINNKGESERSPVSASVERSIQQMMALDDSSQPTPSNDNPATTATTTTTTREILKIKVDDDEFGDFDDDNDHTTGLSSLPDMDPNRQPKVTLGREDRLQIWYGEQSFCLDAGMPLSKRRDDYVDLTTNSLSPQTNNNNNNSPARSSSNLRLSTNKPPTTTKRFKKSH